MIKGHEMIRNLWDENADDPGRSLFSRLLRLPAALYGAASRGRNVAYDRGLIRARRLPRPVISIGNITAGGTGKTPMTVMLAGLLKEAGRKPAILSRGYGREGSGRVIVVADGCQTLCGPREAGDEPFLMANLLPGVPVIAGPSRFLAGQTAIAELAADVLVLDDGFQHRGLHRDLDIVLLDEARPFGNGRLLPRGSLRELPGALRRADLVIMTGSAEGAGSKSPAGVQAFLKEGACILRGRHQPVALIDGGMTARPLTLLAGKRIYAFAGIGNPLSFRRTLEGLGTDLAGFTAFPDHHAFSARDIARLTEEARRAGADLILTTDKDGVRIRDFPEFRDQIFRLRIELEIISGREKFASHILGKLEKNR